MQKSIIFLYYDQDIVNGGFFDNFEYYYLTKKMFKEHDVRLRLVSDSNQDDIFKFINDKYVDVEDFIFDGIEVIEHNARLVMLNPPKIDLLVCATNSSLYWFFQNNCMIVAKDVLAMGDYLDHHPSYDKFFERFHFLYDERVFERRSHLDIPYRKKILFDKYRRDINGGIYDYMLNMSLVERRFPKEFFDKMFEEYKGSYIIYTGSKNKDYYEWMNKIKGVSVIQPPVDNFMDLFNTFIYVPYNNGWDATPRLIPECVFYGKDVIYYDNDSNIKAGGYYRYKDTKEDYRGLWLTEYDLFFKYVRELINA